MRKIKQTTKVPAPDPMGWKRHLDHLNARIEAGETSCNELQRKLSEREVEVTRLKRRVDELKVALDDARFDYETLSANRWFQVIITGLVCLTLCSVVGLAAWSETNR